MNDYKDWDLDGSDRRRIEAEMARRRSDSSEAYASHAGGQYRFTTDKPTSSSDWQQMKDDPYRAIGHEQPHVVEERARHSYAMAIKSYGIAAGAAGQALDAGDVERYEELRRQANEIQEQLEPLRLEWERARGSK